MALRVPIFEVRRGLQPFGYRAVDFPALATRGESLASSMGTPLRKGVTLSDDGLIYSWSRASGPWYALFVIDSGHYLVVRRDKLDVRSVESLRWRYHEHLNFVRRKYQDVVDLVARTDRPHYYEDGGKKKIVLTVERDLGLGRQVSRNPSPVPFDIVSKIGDIDLSDGLVVGQRYLRSVEWSGNAFRRASLLTRLLGVVFDDLLERVLGQRLHTDEFRWRRVVALVNGRRYMVLDKNSANRDGWPDPTDLVIDCDTMDPLPPRFFDSQGSVRRAPLRSPIRRKHTKTWTVTNKKEK